MTKLPDRNLPSARIMSIDALRGFDMFWIIGGDTFMRSLLAFTGSQSLQVFGNQFEHSSWNGFTFDDLIFPLFLFIVGVVMPFSLTKRLERGDNKIEIYKHIFVRSLFLFIFGLLYNDLLSLKFTEMRYAGVLQRIALCYFFSAVIVMNTKIRGQAILTVCILVFYFIVMKFIPVPGLGAGVLTPDGNLASYIDRHFLPGSFCCFEFGDNEGILSTISAVATTLLGVLTGHWLRCKSPIRKKTPALLAAGVLSIILALIWNIIFPINKLIWSSSYVLFAGGLSMILTAFFYWIIDVKGYHKWAFPFIVIGLNPITIYLAQRFFSFNELTNSFVHGIVNNMSDFKPVFLIICVIAVKWLFLYFLYRHKIFFKV